MWQAPHAGPPRYPSREEANQRQPAAHYTDSCKYAGLSTVCKMKKTPLFLLSLMLCWSTAFAAERGIKRVQLSSPDPVIRAAVIQFFQQEPLKPKNGYM